MNAQSEVFEEFKITPREHTRYLPIMLDSVFEQAGLKRSDIDYVSYSNGPGAFTGVRIATATAQGLAIGLGVKLVPVSTLAILAQKTCEQFDVQKVQVALDARMGEAYTATYKINPDSQLVELNGQEQLLKLAELNPPAGIISAGSGFQAWKEAGYKVDDSVEIHEAIYPAAGVQVKLARKSIEMGLAMSADKAEINYIRNKVAEKKRNP